MPAPSPPVTFESFVAELDRLVANFAGFIRSGREVDIGVLSVSVCLS